MYFLFPCHYLSRPQQALIKGKQRLVYFKNIILFPPNEIFDDHIEFAAGTEGIARPGDEVAGLVQVQLQGDGKGNGRGLGGLVARIVADFGEQLAVHIGLFVDFRILFAAAVNELQQLLRESGVQMRQQVVQVA